MRRRLLGLSALALLAGVAVVFMPRYECVMRNDLAACASLQSIASAQARFQGDRRIDLDRDGVGEFGYLAELAGVAALPQGSDAVDEPYLGPRFGYVPADGAVRRSGYRFRVFLPGLDGNGAAEAPPPGRAAVVDPVLAERRWCAYAWPADYGNTGNVTLFIDQDGSVLCADDPRYSGERGPEPGAAYGNGGPTTITGNARANAVAQDGNAWRPLVMR